MDRRPHRKPRFSPRDWHANSTERTTAQPSYLDRICLCTLERIDFMSTKVIHGDISLDSAACSAGPFPNTLSCIRYQGVLPDHSAANGIAFQLLRNPTSERPELSHAASSSPAARLPNVFRAGGEAVLLNRTTQPDAVTVPWVSFCHTTRSSSLDTRLLHARCPLMLTSGYHESSERAARHHHFESAPAARRVEPEINRMTACRSSATNVGTNSSSLIYSTRRPEDSEGKTYSSAEFLRIRAFDHLDDMLYNAVRLRMKRNSEAVTASVFAPVLGVGESDLLDYLRGGEVE